MAQIPILRDLIIIIAVAIVTVNLVNRLHMPSIIGFLLAGMLIGPSFFGVIKGVHQIEILAEIGVVLLLFTIGLEFSLSRLREIWRHVIFGGSFQIILTSAAVMLLASWWKYPLEQAIFFGFLVSLSSTAIVLKVYGLRGELTTLHGNFCVGILLFQDLCIVPMLLLTPILGAQEGYSWGKVFSPLLVSIMSIYFIVLSARFFLPKIIEYVVRMRNQEIFTLFIILLCLSTAWLTSYFGLPLALGAFIAGLLLSESEYSHQALADILPLRDSFAGLFFISIGMLLNFQNLMKTPWLILGLVAIILIIKMVIVFTVMMALRLSWRTSISGAMGLAQIGEFSFLLAQTGLRYNLLSAGIYQQFLASAIISMAATPFLIQLAPRLGFRLQPIMGRLDTMVGAKHKVNSEESGLKKGHVVIIGYGENGRNLARVLQATAIPYVIVDLNTINVHQGKKDGQPIFYGDAGSSNILKKIGVPAAGIAVVAISDPSATRRIVWMIRRISEEIFLIARTRYISEIADLYKLGASQVIPEEFETSIEIFTHVLRKYHIPRNMIELQVRLIREKGYSMLRGLSLPDQKFENIQHLIADMLTETFLVLPQSPAIGRTLGDLHLRLKTGASVVAIIRGNKSVSNPGAQTMIKPQDILVMMGNHSDLDKAIDFLSPETV